MLARTLIVVSAALAALLPVSPAAVESYYSIAVYPRVQHTLTSLSNRVPIALFDVLALGVVAWWTWRLARDISAFRNRGWLRVVTAVAARSASTAAVLYLLFLALWGLNYRRQPLVEKLRFEPNEVTAARARALAEETVVQLNALHQPAHASGFGMSGAVDRALADVFREAVASLGVSPRALVPGVPKRSLFDLYFQRAGVAGMTDPYFLETLISSDLLAFERPAVIAHEWGHLAGFADEGDANFIGWLTCVRSSPAHQYSGWLFLYDELDRVMEGPGSDQPASRLHEGPRRDLLAIRQRLQAHVSPRVSAAGWRAYDGYLKANRIEQGTASYGEVVRLVLGVRFSSNWVPVRAAQ